MNTSGNFLLLDSIDVKNIDSSSLPSLRVFFLEGNITIIDGQYLWITKFLKIKCINGLTCDALELKGDIFLNNVKFEMIIHVHGINISKIQKEVNGLLICGRFLAKAINFGLYYFNDIIEIILIKF